ncbi:MAG: DsrE/DsrF/DrsH-like family protein [Candidatus Eisenbacteria bacterium]
MELRIVDPARVSDLETRVAAIEKNRQRRGEEKSDSVFIVCFSCEWDRLFAAFTIANGALALGQEVHMFFTFWATAALRDSRKACANKSLMNRLLGRFLPRGAENAPLSKMNWGGLGKLFLGSRMRKHGIGGLDELIERSREMGAHFHLCETSAALLGLECKDLIGEGGIDPCGVATFLANAMKGRMVLFI